jgi:hypothetical protein
MYAPGQKPVNGPLFYWYEALDRPGARQMRYVRAIVENELTGADHIAATRGNGYLFVYTAQGRRFTVNMGKISGDRVAAAWYNPRDGSATPAGEFENSGKREFVPPAEGLGADWVLVLDDVSHGSPPPGGVRKSGCGGAALE